VHPDTIDRYYGVDVDSSVLHEELAERIAADQQANIRHEGIDVPQHGSPFGSAQEDLFFQVLAEVVEKDITPAGYGLLSDEWDGDNYPIFEVIHGRRGGKEIQVTLSHPIWKARAKFWVQALNVLSYFDIL
jgi:hypothetical protein